MAARLGAVVALLLLAGALAGSWVGGAAAGPLASSGGLGLSLTADPLNGSAPLVVAFHADLSPSSTQGDFQWNFGDGDAYSDMETGNSTPAHAYATAGTYTATVSVTTLLGDANASIAVRVVAENLAVSIHAQPSGGAAPLTVQFTAMITGGTGTYQSVLWTFGNGDSGSGSYLNYTYPVAGIFAVTLTVADSSGHSVSANATVRVSTAPSTDNTSGNGGGVLVTYLPALLAAAGILGGAAVVATVFRSYTLRRAGEIRAPPGALAGPSAPAAPEPAAVVAPSATAGIPAGTAGDGTGTNREESRRLSERILIHLLWYGRAGSDGIARAEASQQGIARALGSGQNSISKALSRLLDAGAVRVELAHVPGAPRRVKTYSLTPRGEAVARSMARGPGDRRPGRPPAS